MKIDRRHFLATTASLAALASGSLWAESGHAQDLSGLMEPGPLEDMMVGDENAPVTIVEYASMTCPHCASFHTQIYPELKTKYVDTGKVRLIFREFPLDARAYAAAMLARCADKQFYFPMIDVLFKQQSVWARAEDPRPPLLQIAKLAGFTQESFEACLKNQEVLDNVMAVKDKAAKDYKVDSTPTFFINGEKLSGEMSVDAMSAAIDKHL